MLHAQHKEKHDLHNLPLPPSKVPVGFLEHLRDERDICPSTGSLGRFTDVTERIQQHRFPKSQ